ncbi:4-hydroxythreonine-4-phosphate dehydrogenase PdxA [Clostridium tetanomorphum]|uniref:Putative D-threonate 4-phosphate dehydrogenase n=2 Tax=Clostridium tetanomorphum TaxID=1553 RepID=A0A923EBI7_CLOTT|nr:4-hydroxythreonine-4-phosphate dehydrogenase PdxA [Clostridium tetanomorphum]
MMSFIGITMGDPAGVGPEIALKALGKFEEYRKKSIIFGSKNVLQYYKDLLNIQYRLNVISSMEDFDDKCINIVNVLDISMNEFEIGKVLDVCGHCAFKYIETATNWALQNKIKAVVTAPLNKEALHLGGHNFDGHTEIFAALTGTKKYAMMLWSEVLKVIHVSTHVALREACNMTTKERILDVIKLADETLKNMGIAYPRIAVAGLNPHSGESGIFGNEEMIEIYPAIKQARDININVEGPVPPDTVFLKAYKGQYDIVVAMYHDQGHIPIKLLAFDLGVNITVGLPIVRTSVDHGTAFDIAGKGIAKEESMVNALKVADMFK